jgi:two-component system nitrate/nitrite response regulator NarL
VLPGRAQAFDKTFPALGNPAVITEVVCQTRLDDVLNENQVPSSTPIRIVIADAEPDFRTNLRRVLTAKPGFEILGEASDAAEAAALTARFAPHVLLLDYALSLELQACGAPIRAGFASPVRTIVMLTAPERANLIESFRLGAHGIVLKGSAHPVWQNSIAAVAAGQYWLGNESLAVLIQAICESPASNSGPLPAKYYGLTPREIEIVQKIASGRSNKEVGRDFSIRERTVKHHLTNIFVKVGVSSRLELALFARDHKITLSATTEVASATAEPGNGCYMENGRPRRMAIRNRSELKSSVENA